MATVTGMSIVLPVVVPNTAVKSIVVSPVTGYKDVASKPAPIEPLNMYDVMVIPLIVKPIILDDVGWLGHCCVTLNNTLPDKVSPTS